MLHIYTILLPKLQQAARELEYGLAVHGSGQRDLDLVAVPWSETAPPPAQLVAAFQRVAGATSTMGPVPLPHGRQGYALWLDAEHYLDLSITPYAPTDAAGLPPLTPEESKALVDLVASLAERDGIGRPLTVREQQLMFTLAGSLADRLS